MPELEAGHDAPVTKEVRPGLAFVRVLFDRERAHHRYQLIEPTLTETQQRALHFIREALLRTMDVEMKYLGRDVSDESLAYLRGEIEEVVKDYHVRLTPVGRQRVEYYLERDFVGAGAIDVIMRDQDIEDVSCDGIGVPVFVYHRRYGSMESTLVFDEEEALDALVIRMAQRAGKQITVADPLVDGALPDGSRLQATLGHEVTDNGSTFTIRRFNTQPFSPIDLVRMGTLDPQMLAYLWILVQYGASMVFSGGTASGKTTTLNAVSLFIPPEAKIVSIEDTREINLPHPNWVRSVTRGSARSLDAKQVGMFDLLVAALRQRPEYILVGEVRGKEATVAFQAMATGHTVYATLHADSARSVVYRLENDPINVPRLVLQALDVIVLQALVTVGGKRMRRIKEIVEIVDIDPSSKELLTHTVFTWDPADDTYHYAGKSYKLDRIARTNTWSGDRVRQELERRTDIVRRLGATKGLSFDDIARVAATYRRRPEHVDDIVEELVTRARNGDEE
jgi:flagellar protein FlaI